MLLFFTICFTNKCLTTPLAVHCIKLLYSTSMSHYNVKCSVCEISSQGPQGLPCSLKTTVGYTAQLTPWYNNTQRDLLSECKAFQLDSGALSNGNNVRELHLDLWLVFAHHTWQGGTRPNTLLMPSLFDRMSSSSGLTFIKRSEWECSSRLSFGLRVIEKQSTITFR